MKVFYTNPWLSETEFDEIFHRSFSSSLKDSQKNKTEYSFESYEKESRQLIKMIFPKLNEKLQGGTIADDFLIGEIGDLYLPQYNQYCLKLATAYTIYAKASGWKPTEEILSQISVNNGPVSTSIGDFNYGSPWEKLPHEAQMLLRAADINYYASGGTPITKTDPELFVKVEQLIALNVKYNNETYSNVQEALDAIFEEIAKDDIDLSNKVDIQTGTYVEGSFSGTTHKINNTTEEGVDLSSRHIQSAGAVPIDKKHNLKLFEDGTNSKRELSTEENGAFVYIDLDEADDNYLPNAKEIRDFTGNIKDRLGDAEEQIEDNKKAIENIVASTPDQLEYNAKIKSADITWEYEVDEDFNISNIEDGGDKVEQVDGITFKLNAIEDSNSHTQTNFSLRFSSSSTRELIYKSRVLNIVLYEDGSFVRQFPRTYVLKPINSSEEVEMNINYTLIEGKTYSIKFEGVVVESGGETYVGSGKEYLENVAVYVNGFDVVGYGYTKENFKEDALNEPFDKLNNQSIVDAININKGNITTNAALISELKDKFAYTTTNTIEVILSFGNTLQDGKWYDDPNVGKHQYIYTDKYSISSYFGYSSPTPPTDVDTEKFPSLNFKITDDTITETLIRQWDNVNKKWINTISATPSTDINKLNYSIIPLDINYKEDRIFTIEYVGKGSGDYTNDHDKSLHNVVAQVLDDGTLKVLQTNTQSIVGEIELTKKVIWKLDKANVPEGYVKVVLLQFPSNEVGGNYMIPFSEEGTSNIWKIYLEQVIQDIISKEYIDKKVDIQTGTFVSGALSGTTHQINNTTEEGIKLSSLNSLGGANPTTKSELIINNKKDPVDPYNNITERTLSTHRNGAFVYIDLNEAEDNYLPNTKEIKDYVGRKQTLADSNGNINFQVNDTDINAFGNVLRNVGDPIEPTDATNKKYVDEKISYSQTQLFSGSQNSGTITLSEDINNFYQLVIITENTTNQEQFSNIILTSASSGKWDFAYVNGSGRYIQGTISGTSIVISKQANSTIKGVYGLFRK